MRPVIPAEGSAPRDRMPGPVGKLPVLIGVVLVLLASCRGGPTECPGDAPAARAARAAAAHEALVALGAGFFTVASFDVVHEDRVRWQPSQTLEGASTEEKRLVFYRVRFDAILVPTGADGPRDSFPASLEAPTWEKVQRNAELLRVGLPPRSAPGRRVEISAYAVFDVTGPGTVTFRGFDDRDREELVPHPECPDGRGGQL